MENPENCESSERTEVVESENHEKSAEENKNLNGEDESLNHGVVSEENEIPNGKNESLETENQETAEEDKILNGGNESAKLENKNYEKTTEENEPIKTEFSEKEKDYIEMVFALESEKQTLIEESRAKITQLKKELEDSQVENEKLRRKNAQLEQSLVQKEANGKDVSKSKNEQYDVLTKAKTLLFEKTKVCKQQEQHIEALKIQTDSIKEVLAITKDMLNLRNIENEHLQSRLDTIDLRFKAEKDRQVLLEKKLDISKKMYDELRKEYDYQASLHKEIKAAYQEKVKVLDSELQKALNTEK